MTIQHPNVPQAHPLKFRNVVRGKGGPKEAVNDVIDDKEELEDYAQDCTGEDDRKKLEAAKPRFEREKVIAVALGQRPTPAYEVEIVSVVQITGGFVGLQTQINYVTRGPSGPATPPDALTLPAFPHHAVRVKNAGGLIVFRDLTAPRPTTLAVGEEDPRPTTLAVGEEEPHFTTLAVGEEGPHPTTLAVGEEEPQPTTLAVGEEDPTTRAVGEEGPTTLAVGEEDPQPTTLAVGEEEPRYTTLAVGEEGPQPTTLAVGEEGPGPTTLAVGEEEPRYTTLAVGEEEPRYTTLAVGEEDPRRRAPEDPTTLATGEEGGTDPTTLATGEETSVFRATTLAVGEESWGGWGRGGGGPFGGY